MILRFVVTICLMSIMSGTSQELNVMTYNIRYATVNDKENQWDNRKDFLAAQILFYEPEIIGTQEGLGQQITYLDKSLEEYSYVGVGRDDGKQQGEYCAIFYKKSRLLLLSQDTFWLSKTPEKVSIGWDAALERICTMALFMDKDSGRNFWVFNTHFDHIGKQAREKSAELIVNKIRELNKDNFPVFLLGDFNLNENSGPIKLLATEFRDSKNISEEKPFGPHGTFTGFEYHEAAKDRIDYIFTSKKGVSVKKYAVLSDAKDGRYPSDHFPVLIKAVLLDVDK